MDNTRGEEERGGDVTKANTDNLHALWGTLRERLRPGYFKIITRPCITTHTLLLHANASTGCSAGLKSDSGVHSRVEHESTTISLSIDSPLFLFAVTSIIPHLGASEMQMIRRQPQTLRPSGINSTYTTAHLSVQMLCYLPEFYRTLTSGSTRALIIHVLK